MSSSYEEVAQQTNSTGFSAGIQRNEFGQLPPTVKQQLVDQERRKRVRANSSLPEGSWKSVDNMVFRTLDEQLVIVNDLREAGLVSSVPVSARFSEWNVVDDRGEATVAMSPETEDAESSVSFAPRIVPIPCVFDTFSTGYREQAVPGEAPSGAQSVDSLGASVASRNVGETMERLVWDGWDIEVLEPESGQTTPLYGITNHPDRNTTDLSDWSTATSGGGTYEIYSDIRAMRNTLKNPPNNYNPPASGFWLYLSTDLYDVLDGLTDRENTIRSLVDGIASVGRIREAPQLDPGTAIMFSPEMSVIDLSIPRAPTPIQWSPPPGFRDHMMVLGIFAPRVKSTKSGQSGIIHGTVA